MSAQVSTRGDYTVGYGKPPKHTRFQKGRSGNGQGRPKGARNLKTDLKGVLEEELPLTIGGREVKLSARRAMLLALRNKALKGDVRAIAMLVNLVERLMPESLLEDVKSTVAKDDAVIFAEAIERHMALRTTPPKQAKQPEVRKTTHEESPHA